MTTFKSRCQTQSKVVAEAAEYLTSELSGDAVFIASVLRRYAKDADSLSKVELARALVYAIKMYEEL